MVVEFPKVNVFDVGVPVTLNFPLNPELPTPVMFVELLTFLILTISLTLNLCGSADVTVTTSVELVISAITFGFRLLITFTKLSSTSTLLDSCKT